MVEMKTISSDAGCRLKKIANQYKSTKHTIITIGITKHKIMGLKK
jgi:hypothetical protein